MIKYQFETVRVSHQTPCPRGRVLRVLNFFFFTIPRDTHPSSRMPFHQLTNTSVLSVIYFLCPTGLSFGICLDVFRCSFASLGFYIPLWGVLAASSIKMKTSWKWHCEKNELRCYKWLFFWSLDFFCFLSIGVYTHCHPGLIWNCYTWKRPYRMVFGSSFLSEVRIGTQALMQ